MGRQEGKRIKQNQKQQQQPVITVKTGNQNVYANQVEIPGGCRIVYRPDSPICGARVWIETLYDVKVISFSDPRLRSWQASDF